MIPTGLYGKRTEQAPIEQVTQELNQRKSWLAL